MNAEPLVRDPIISGLIIVGAIVVACVIARAIEYWEHRRDQRIAAERRPWDDRERQSYFNRIMGNRK